MSYDKQLYSRQEFTVGSDAQSKISNAEVLLVGLSGPGIEIAKNLALIGVARIKLLDNAVISYDDLSTNFFADEGDVGKVRGSFISLKLTELNPSIDVQVLNYQNIAAIPMDEIKNSCITIVVNHPFSENDVIQLNKSCRSHETGFVLIESYGVAGCIFVDFGQSFRVHDKNGEDFSPCLIEAIGEDGTVKCFDDQKHGLECGDIVEFKNMMNPLQDFNRKRLYVKDVKSPYSFTIEAEIPTPYQGGGQIIGVKQESIFSFESLESQIQAPTIVPSDFAKFEDGLLLHQFFRSVHDFTSAFKRLPGPNDTDAEYVVNGITDLPEPSKDNVELIKRFARCSTGSFVGLSSFLGGMAAHEALKGICNKFTPIQQFYYFDAREILPPDEVMQSYEHKNTGRYCGQQRLFGPYNDLFSKQKYFIVGAGALGCELVKNFAMSGVGCSPDGKVFITDMDTIEKSNLSRQFLFRDSDIGKFKSLCAADRARSMNAGINIVPLQEKVSSESTEIFTDNFWENLDGVCTALDNVESRQWVDNRCVYYRKPLIDSGTLGSSANLQVVVPELTESYSSSIDPPEKAIPVCTLKNFPSKIEHCIQWARDSFEGLFFTQILQAKQFLTDRAKFMEQIDRDPSTKDASLKSVFNILSSAPKTARDCSLMARKLFDELFLRAIRDLLTTFPPNSLTSEGKPFWSGTKKQPICIEFDPQNEDHAAFVVSAAMLFREAFSVHEAVTSEADILSFAAANTDSIAKTDGEAADGTKKRNRSDEELIDELTFDSVFESAHAQGLKERLRPIGFEKDDDANFHIQFITTCSNVRASNYGIDRTDFHSTKRIAGRIIPAMITTTSSIVGLVMIELSKIIMHSVRKTPVEAFKNAFLNFAIGFTAFSEPLQPKVSAYGPADDPFKHKWTLWSRFDVDFGRNITVKELLSYFEQEHRITVSMLSCGVAIVYSLFSSKRSEVLALTVTEAVKLASKKEIPEHVAYLDFELLCAADDVDVDVPPVRFKIYHYSYLPIL